MNDTDRKLFAVLFAGTMLWVGVPLAMMLVPADPARAGFLGKPPGPVIAILAVAWLLACGLGWFSLRIRGSGGRFQFMRAMAFIPVWSLVVLPVMAGIAMALLGILFGTGS